MGNTTSASKVVNDVVNKSMTNVIMSNSSTCGQNNTGIQDVDFSNIKAAPGCSLDISSSQKFSQVPNFSCVASNSNSISLQAAFETALSAAAKAEVSGQGIGNSQSNSDVIQKVVNDISNNISVSTTSNCIQNSMANQKAIFDAIESSCPKICNQELKPSDFTPNFTLDDYGKLCTTSINSVQELVQAATASCLADNTTIQEAITTVATQLKGEATSSTTGLTMAGSAGVSFIILLILCVILSAYMMIMM